VVAASQTYAGACGFVIVLSIGEMIWSPRWYDYTMACAPPGREGVFGALALMPLFVAKLPTGILGGYLLQRYCPAAQGGDCPVPGRGGGIDEGIVTDPFNNAKSFANATNTSAAGGWSSAGAATGAGCNGRVMWSVIGLVTLTSPVLIALFYPLLRSSGEDGGGGGGGGGGSSLYAYEDLDAPVMVMDGDEPMTSMGGGGVGRGGSALEGGDDAELELMPLEPALLPSA
jgi:hypothetical protein